MNNRDNNWLKSWKCSSLIRNNNQYDIRNVLYMRNIYIKIIYAMYIYIEYNQEV